MNLLYLRGQVNRSHSGGLNGKGTPADDNGNLVLFYDDLPKKL